PIRAPLSLSIWWKCTSWSRTAVYAFTSTFTRPKLTAPLHSARAMVVLYPIAASGSEARRPLVPAPTGHLGQTTGHVDGGAVLEVRADDLDAHGPAGSGAPHGRHHRGQAHHTGRLHPGELVAVGARLAVDEDGAGVDVGAVVVR